MSEIEKRGWEDELNAAWAEVNKARRELAKAVEALREVARLLDRSTQTGGAPTKDEWAALTLANAAIAAIEGQSA
jgi:hypothetical protein